MTLGRGLSSQGISTLPMLRLKSLQSLCLNGNVIGPEGCAHVASFMESNGAPLRTLELANNILCQGEPKKDMPPPSNLNPATGHYNSYEANLDGFSRLLKIIESHPTLREVDFR